MILLDKYLRKLKKKDMEKQYRNYYGTMTVRDKEEMELMEDFTFSDRSLELLLETEEADV